MRATARDWGTDMRSARGLAILVAAATALLPGIVVAADGTLSLRMSNDQRLFVYIVRMVGAGRT